MRADSVGQVNQGICVCLQAPDGYLWGEGYAAVEVYHCQFCKPGIYIFIICFGADPPNVKFLTSAHLFSSVPLLDMLHILLQIWAYPARIGMTVFRHALLLILMMVQRMLLGQNMSLPQLCLSRPPLRFCGASHDLIC